MPRYSFIIPAYNEEAVLPKCLQAILASAKDLRGGFEIIVVNDASTDRTAEIARALGITVIDVHKRQIGAVRNAGAATATGDIFVFVDADTFVNSETLHEMDRLLQNPKIVAGGAWLIFDDPPPPLWGRVAAKIFLTLYFAAKLAAGGFLFARREAFEKAGRFDERFFASEEVHLSVALKKLGKLVIIKHPVITSARKFRMKSFRQHAALFKVALRKGKRAWQERDGLDMWYDGQREK